MKLFQSVVVMVVLALGASLAAAQGEGYAELAKQAGEAVQAKEYAKAIELYEQAREAATRENQRASATYQIAGVYITQKEYDAARTVYQSLIDGEKTPAATVANAQFQLGRSYTLERKWAEAEAPLRTAADGTAGTPAMRFNARSLLVSSLDSSGQYDQAAEAVDALVVQGESLNPRSHITALTRKGQFLSQRRGEHEAGRALLEEALAIEGQELAATQASTRYQLGLILVREKKNDEAKELFETLLAEEVGSASLRRSIQAQLNRLK